MLLMVSAACQKDQETDKEKPAIDLTIADAFPVNCDTLYFGEPFELNVLFSDNVELGSYSIDIHNNFDHHSHSTEVTVCELAPVKTPVNPFMSVDDFGIPAGEKTYQANLTISIPSDNDAGLYDDGDYHFFIRLTDKEGWSAQKGLNIKILHGRAPVQPHGRAAVAWLAWPHGRAAKKMYFCPVNQSKGFHGCGL